MKQLYVVMAMCAMGEGLLAMLYPRRYAFLWTIGPRPLREAARFFADNPGLTRCAGAAELVGALLIARQQIEE